MSALPCLEGSLQWLCKVHTALCENASLYSWWAFVWYFPQRLVEFVFRITWHALKAIDFLTDTEESLCSLSLISWGEKKSMNLSFLILFLFYLLKVKQSPFHNPLFVHWKGALEGGNWFIIPGGIIQEWSWGISSSPNSPLHLFFGIEQDGAVGDIQWEVYYKLHTCPCLSRFGDSMG